MNWYSERSTLVIDQQLIEKQREKHLQESILEERRRLQAASEPKLPLAKRAKTKLENLFDAIILS